MDDEHRPAGGAPVPAPAIATVTDRFAPSVAGTAGDAGDTGDALGLPTPTAPGTDRLPSPRARRAPIGRVLALLLAGVVVFGGGVLVGRSGTSSAPPASPGPTSTAGALATPTNPATTTPAAPSATSATPVPSGVPTPDFALATEAWNLIYGNYVDVGSLDPTTLEQGAVRGLLEAVGDTGHTGYLTPEQVKAFNEELSGTFVGIGVTVNERDGYPTIIRVLPDSPALRAGLQVGEKIVDVAGKSSLGRTIDDIVTDVRGPEGTPVTITVRALDGSERTLTLIRAKLDLPLVSWALVPGTTYAAIRLEQFAAGAGDDVANALKEARAAGATGILLDLRANPGGFTTEAVNVASQFLSSGDVYLTRDRSGTQVATPVTPGGVATDLPLVVLVDGLTASSSEIVAGALQDAGRATIVGERTFGTGTVLGTFPLPDGSAVTIGVQRWLTPNGRAIWKEGIPPDVTAVLPSGASLVLPGDLSTLGAAGIASSTDSQLRAGLEALKKLAGD